MTCSTVALCLLATYVAAPLDLEAGEPKPGLVAEYRSVAKPQLRATRMDAKPAFTLGRSSPHPGIPQGPFEVTWTGVIAIKEKPLMFSAFVGGEVEVTIDGVVVLDGRGATEGAQIKGKAALAREAGHYPLTITYRSLADVPARLQMWWQGDSFAGEPLPPWRLGHLDRDEKPHVKAALAAQTGNQIVREHGCARCHASSFPAITEIPGPSLVDAGQRLDRSWLMHYLADPMKVRADAHMPAVFANDRNGFVERWLVAESLTATPKREAPTGDHRRGRLAFIRLGCATCHFLPDIDVKEQKPLGQRSLATIADRMSAADISTFLGNPLGRYPDGRMPRLPISPAEAHDIAAYLLLWSKPTKQPGVEAPKPEEVQAALKKLGVQDRTEAATKLLREKGCMSCHIGLGESRPRDVAIKDPSANCRGATFSPDVLKLAKPYTAIAASENYPSPFTERQRQLQRAGCVKCHQRDTDRQPFIEVVGSTLGGAFLQPIPFQRTPRLTNPHQKYTRSHLTATVREGISSLRGSSYTYRMPAFGTEAEVLVRALAEADGELVTATDPAEVAPSDPTLGTVHGSQLAGFQGYGCVSCHVWNGKALGSPDPAAIGPDLVRTTGRIRRDWFDRFLESPMRFHPNTPMPGVFQHGKPAMLDSVLGGDATKQKDALWAYLAKGKDAPSPAAPPPVPIDAPAAGVLVAQIPIRLGGNAIESVCVLTAENDLLVYDLGERKPVALFVGAQILRTVQGRIRQFQAVGTAVEVKFASRKDVTFPGYDRLADGVALRWKDATETIRFVTKDGKRQLVRDSETITLPPAKKPPAWPNKPAIFPDAVEGSLERPGYKAVAYPRPKTVSGEDRIMPGAVAVRPKDSKVFVASMKTGELFALDAKKNTFELYGRGLYQDALSMLAEDDGLYVLHRRNLTKVVERDGVADRFDRVFALTHDIADSYDMAYGLARDRAGAFVLSYAPYANTTLVGSGSALRLSPGKKREEISFGMRNPFGWCSGPDGEVFFTDNQGDWVASNKLAHVGDGKFHGWPNRSQPQHHKKPIGKATVWVPYAWAQSINGVAFDNTGGKFGPFAGQFFMAELMYGGAIIRANVEKVNGEYQGACFPFWGKGLLGPLCLAFDPRGKLYVGGVTEPGWMAQPDRGALFRIDYTGKVPFEMQSIHARPQGFRIVFTAPVDKKLAGEPTSYALESYRYEYTGAYGSPELDRTRVQATKALVSEDGTSVELTTAPLVKDRVYLLSIPKVKSASGQSPVHSSGAYTLNEIPVK